MWTSVFACAPASAGRQGGAWVLMLGARGALPMRTRTPRVPPSALWFGVRWCVMAHYHPSAVTDRNYATDREAELGTHRNTGAGPCITPLAERRQPGRQASATGADARHAWSSA